MTIELHAVCTGRVVELAPGRCRAIDKRPVLGDTVEDGPLTRAFGPGVS